MQSSTRSVEIVHYAHTACLKTVCYFLLNADWSRSFWTLSKLRGCDTDEWVICLFVPKLAKIIYVCHGKDKFVILGMTLVHAVTMRW